MKAELPGVLEVAAEGFDEVLYDRPVVNKGLDFKIDLEASGIEVGRPHRDDGIVSHEYFRVYEPPLVAVDLHSGLQEFFNA